MSLGRFSECEGASTVIPNVASYPCSLDSACHSERLAAVPFAILLLDRAARSRGTLRCGSIALRATPYLPPSADVGVNLRPSAAREPYSLHKSVLESSAASAALTG